MEQNHLCNFSRRHYKEHLCEIILNFDLWFRRRCRLKIYFIWSSGSPQNHLCNCGRGYHGDHFCEIILNLDQLFRRRSRLQTFLFLSSGGPFVRRGETICVSPCQMFSFRCGFSVGEKIECTSPVALSI